MLGVDVFDKGQKLLLALAGDRRADDVGGAFLPLLVQAFHKGLDVAFRAQAALFVRFRENQQEGDLFLPQFADEGKVDFLRCQPTVPRL